MFCHPLWQQLPEEVSREGCGQALGTRHSQPSSLYGLSHLGAAETPTRGSAGVIDRSPVVTQQSLLFTLLRGAMPAPGQAG